MSARGRNLATHEQDALGAYDTPEGVCRAVWREILREPAFLGMTRLLEPHAGRGNWIRTIPEGLVLDVEIMDIDPTVPAILEAPQRGWDVTPCAPAQSLVRAGFLVTEPRRRPDLVAGNPPFSLVPPKVRCPDCLDWPTPSLSDLRLCKRCDNDRKIQPPAIFVATSHVVRALRVTRRHVIFLLRVGFVGSSKRLPLFRRITPRHEWRLFPRPRFRWGGSDASEYSVLWWDLEHSRAHGPGPWTSSVLEWSEE